jgi:hypothetical protein
VQLNCGYLLVGVHKNMSGKIVKYRDWTFLVDFERTKDIYDSVPHGSPEVCNCDKCKNFAANRHNAYPDEIEELLNELGIDIKKEAEVYHMGLRTEDGQHHYGGWFHFKGQILKGVDFRFRQGANVETSDTINVNDSFIIWLTRQCTRHFFEDEEVNSLIQLEFATTSNWVIDKGLESKE